MTGCPFYRPGAPAEVDWDDFDLLGLQLQCLCFKPGRQVHQMALCIHQTNVCGHGTEHWTSELLGAFY